MLAQVCWGSGDRLRVGRRFLGRASGREWGRWGSGDHGALTRSLEALDPIRADRARQVGRSSSVSGEVLHLPNLVQVSPGGVRGGRGINRCFQGRALSRLADVAQLHLLGWRHSWEGRGFCPPLLGLEHNSQIRAAGGMFSICSRAWTLTHPWLQAQLRFSSSLNLTPTPATLSNSN